jgi:hypothetical protein
VAPSVANLRAAAAPIPAPAPVTIATLPLSRVDISYSSPRHADRTSVREIEWWHNGKVS